MEEDILREDSTPKESEMEIHKPKPVHSWRAATFQTDRKREQEK
jgi:hypothetical protein